VACKAWDCRREWTCKLNDENGLNSCIYMQAHILMNKHQSVSWLYLCWIPENGEDIQVLRYEHGQKYDPHYDYFTDKINIVRGGHRIATVLMYLTNVTKGGETVFPSAEVCITQVIDVCLSSENKVHLWNSLSKIIFLQWMALVSSWISSVPLYCVSWMCQIFFLAEISLSHIMTRADILCHFWHQIVKDLETEKRFWR